MKIFSQLKSALLEKLASPSFAAAEEGRIVYNTTRKIAQVNNGGGFSDVTGFTSVSKAVADDGDAVSDNQEVHIDSSGGVFGLDLPAISTDGQRIRLIDATENFAANNVTITPDGTDTINGDATLVLDVQKGHVELVSNGADWEVLGLYVNGGTVGPATSTTLGTVYSYGTYVKVVSGTTITVQDGTNHPLIHTIVGEDALGEYNTTTGEFTATEDGVYAVNPHLRWFTTNSGVIYNFWSLSYTLNGSSNSGTYFVEETLPGTTSMTKSVSPLMHITMTAGQKLKLSMYVSSSGTTGTNIGTVQNYGSNTLTITRIR